MYMFSKFSRSDKEREKSQRGAESAAEERVLYVLYDESRRVAVNRRTGLERISSGFLRNVLELFQIQYLR